MRVLTLSLLLTLGAAAQNISVPALVRFSDNPDKCSAAGRPGDFSRAPQPATLSFKTDTGSLPFTAATKPNSWLLVSPPSSGTVTPSGVNLQLTVDPSKAFAGTQRSYVAITINNDRVYLVSVEVDCVPTPTLIISDQKLSYSFVQGGPAQTKNFLVAPNTGNEPDPSRPLEFTITWDTPPYNPSWITFAGAGLEGGQGKFVNTSPIAVAVVVDPKNLPVGNTVGYLHIMDKRLEGIDSIEVTVEVTPKVEVPDPKPVITQNGISDAAGGRPTLAPGAWASVYGKQLAPDTVAEGRSWRDSEFVNGRLPVTLDGVSVSIGGKDAAIAFLNNGQINFLVPADAPPGSGVPVVVKTSKGSSAAANVNIQDYAPGFFLFSPTRYVAAQHADYSNVGSANPAKPGETIILYATGFGRTDPPTPPGMLVGGGARIVAPVSVRIGGAGAVVQSYLSAIGLYQLNVTVPTTLPDGDHPVVAAVGGIETQPNVMLAVRR